jgi:hypothetical protein
MDGIERAAGRSAEPPLSLDIAFYGDLFLPTQGNRKGGGPAAAWDAMAAAEDIPEEEVHAFSDAVREIVDPAVLQQAATLPAAKGYTALPAPLRLLVRAVDSAFGAGMGLLLFGVFRQVTFYLRDQEMRQLIDGRVEAAVADDTRLIVGHSLGSVIAFEYLRIHPGRNLSLITLGSPLGLRLVRDALPASAFPTSPESYFPPAVWTNVRDPRDPVACAGELGHWWSQACDKPVSNGGDAHSATRYLGKKPTGEAILAIFGKDTWR